MGRDKSSNQLNEYKLKNKGGEPLMTSTGAPIDEKLNSLSAGERGPLLLQDFTFTDEMAHFNRERIPERVVHAKGAGAKGFFEVTHDISKYCKADIFNKIGKKTPVAVRFSTVGGESGSADTARDPRGFAVKFYTEEGNWDLVGNNTPIFFIRDPIFFPSFIHTQKRNPVTHLKDPDMFWDFISLRPETCHQVSFLFSDRGTPMGYRHMNGYGSHTFKLVNIDGEAVYCKFHFKCDQGIKCFYAEEADKMGAEDPDYAIRDLYNAIASGKPPTWTLHIQVMTFDEAENFKWNPFDLTKTWPQGEFPLIPVGKMTLNENPKNYFAEVEQIAFSPSHMVPGVEPSPDKMLQGRLFSYPDTHRHRLGSNYMQIPINCPFQNKRKVTSYQRDGPQCVTDNNGGAPNYFPNSFNGPVDGMRAGASRERQTRASTFQVSGDVKRWNTADDDNFTQVGIFFNNVLNEEERIRLASNIGNHLKGAQKFLQQRAIANFSKCDSRYGSMIQSVVNGEELSSNKTTVPAKF